MKHFICYRICEQMPFENGSEAVHIDATSSNAAVMKSNGKATKKRTRDKIDLVIERNDGAGAQPIAKKIKRLPPDFDSFPSEILQKIFDAVDDTGLMYLAEMSHKFEAIAQIAYQQKCTNNYFIINGSSNVDDIELY